MKGGKKRPSVDPPPPPPAVDGGEECAEGDHQSSIPPNSPLIDGPVEEDLSQHQPQQKKKKTTTTTVEKEKGVLEEEAPVAEEEEEGYEEEEEEEEGERGNERSEKLQMEEGEEEEGDDERPKLAEGYYEIEAVRRKRIRKGQAQYLIKWRGWPETANTWEPLENLLSCSDVIDAFEESSRSGKRSSRKRRRKSGTTQSQTKKKQQQPRSPAVSTHSVPYPPLEDPHTGETDAAGANHSEPVSYRADIAEQPNELYLKISQLKLASTANADCEDERPNGVQKAEGSEAVQPSRCTGAKRRKSGSVKRFKLEMPSDAMDGQQNVETTSGDLGTTDSLLKNKAESSKAVCDITEIIRPVSYSASMIDNRKEVSVSFIAKRADGKEVTVDNKFLKANHPFLLINFYEQHLRYNSA